MTNTTVSFFTCLTVGDATVIAAYPAIDCTSSEYKSVYVVFLLVAILFVAGGPALIAAFLFRKHRNNTLNEEHNVLAYGVLCVAVVRISR